MRNKTKNKRFKYQLENVDRHQSQNLTQFFVSMVCIFSRGDQSIQNDSWVYINWDSKLNSSTHHGIDFETIFSTSLRQFSGMSKSSYISSLLSSTPPNLHSHSSAHQFLVHTSNKFDLLQEFSIKLLTIFDFALY